VDALDELWDTTGVAAQKDAVSRPKSFSGLQPSPV
jgi:hypothetical protein